MPFDNLLVERRGSAIWIILNRPEELNALNQALLDELGQALSQAECDSSALCLVIRGAGRAFCAGADLRFVAQMPQAERASATANFLLSATSLMTRLEAFPKPVIGAVNGIAIAGGLELLLCCDLVVAAENARFGDGHANFGLLPGAGASVRLPRKVGLMVAKYLFFTGDTVNAAEMKAAGLVNEVAPDLELDGAVMRLTNKLALKSPLGLKYMKLLSNASVDEPAIDGLRRELAVNAEYALSFDRNEGLAAFNEKRVPRFEGR